jgi:tetratricopeptide (TPR) repeat protein
LAVLIIYALLSFLRNRDWKDRLTLFRKDIEHVENSAQAHNLLAFHLAMEAQRITSIPERNAMLQEATVHFKRATEIWPGFMNATYDLGRVLEQLGRWREAIDAYFRTYQIDSTFTDAIFRAGIVYENLPNIDSAIVCYEHVIKENPANTAAFNNLSYIYFRSKNYRKAIEISTQAYAANPQNTDPLVNIGKTFLNINQPDSAIFYFERAYPYRRGDAGLVQILYQLWKEKNSDSSKTQYYLGEMQRMGIAK